MPKNKFDIPVILTGLLMLLGACSNQPPYPEESALEFHPTNGGITLPPSFQAVVVANNLGPARHLTVDDNGDIYVMLREPNEDGNGIVALRDTNNDGKADVTEYFGDISGTGIQYYAGHLYASSNSEVIRYPLGGDELVPSSSPEVIIDGFPEQDYHTAKSFTFDDKGNIYVNIAAPSNACQQQSRTPGSPGMEPCPQLERQAGIWRFDATQPGQTQQDDGYRYATGIRNAIAMDWNSSVDNLYIVQHGRDQLHELWPEYYDEEDNAELPAEEFFRVTDGMNAGWPYTYYDGRDNVRVVAPEYGGNGEEQPEGEEYRDPILAFPAHWAPNGLIFYSSDLFPEKYRNGAFIAFHGSWNRAPLPQQGYNVVYVPFNGEMPSGDYEVFADGFKGTETLESPENAEARPMGLAIGPDGSLYISDSMRGKIWRVVYTGR